MNITCLRPSAEQRRSTNRECIGWVSSIPAPPSSGHQFYLPRVHYTARCTPLLCIPRGGLICSLISGASSLPSTDILLPIFLFGLAIVRMASSLPPLPPSYVQANQGYPAQACAIAFIAIAVCFSSLKVLARAVTRTRLGWDDWLLIPSLVSFLVECATIICTFSALIESTTDPKYHRHGPTCGSWTPCGCVGGREPSNDRAVRQSATGLYRFLYPCDTAPETCRPQLLLALLPAERASHRLLGVGRVNLGVLLYSGHHHHD